MAQHRVTVTIPAPVHQVYELFSHFNDYPKFMTYVKEVTYLDERRSHWVIDMLGQHEWDAVNEEWIPDRQIGWRSTSGVTNSGRVFFTPLPNDQTTVTVEVSYDPPGGIIGTVAESLIAGAQFEQRLRHDLEQFAAMVLAAPRGALDPNSSAHLFHAQSAAAQGHTTPSQNQTMAIADSPDTVVLSDLPSTTSVINDG